MSLGSGGSSSANVFYNSLLGGGTIGGNLVVAGNLEVKKDFEVDGSITISGDLIIDDLSLNSLEVSGNTVLNTCDISALTCINTAQFDASANIDGNLVVVGSTQLQGGCDISGLTCINDAQFDTSLNVSGNVNIDQRLNVDGSMNVLADGFVLGALSAGGSIGAPINITGYKLIKERQNDDSTPTANGTMYYTTTAPAPGTFTDLLIGASGEYLVSNGTAPQWSAIPPTPTPTLTQVLTAGAGAGGIAITGLPQISSTGSLTLSPTGAVYLYGTTAEFGSSGQESYITMSQSNNTLEIRQNNIPTGINNNSARTSLPIVFKQSNGNQLAWFGYGTYNYGIAGTLPSYIISTASHATAINIIKSGAYAFTGQHPSQLTEEVIDGLLVSNTGELFEPSRINDVRVKCEITKTRRDPNVFGVVALSDPEPNHYMKSLSPHQYNILSEPMPYKLLSISSVGEGCMLVVNTAPIHRGDYLCSSSVAGFAEKQDDDIHHSYTVAKALVDCDFTATYCVMRMNCLTADGQNEEDASGNLVWRDETTRVYPLYDIVATASNITIQDESGAVLLTINTPSVAGTYKGALIPVLYQN